MEIQLIHTSIGQGTLITEGEVPVFIAEDGVSYGPSDKFPAYNSNTGYLHRDEGVNYTAEQLQWIDDYVVETHVNPRYETFVGEKPWRMGATLKNAEQLARIETILGNKIVLNGK